MTINCRGQLIDLSLPKVMGIINVTPDSFFDGGTIKSDDDLLRIAENMLKEGATFLDVGGYSSRPGADHIIEDLELQRTIPAIELLSRKFPDTFISVDTFRSKVAQEALEHGAVLVNDISAGRLDPNMLKTVANYKAPYIMMHMQGTPQTMDQLVQYEDIIKDILFYFSERIAIARDEKLIDLIIDPGFGFSKTLEQNYKILDQLEIFNLLEKPILVGFSRKSMVYKPLQTNAKNALNGTTVLNTIALQKGAKILRVHDIKEAMEAIKMCDMLSYNY